MLRRISNQDKRYHIKQFPIILILEQILPYCVFFSKVAEEQE